MAGWDDIAQTQIRDREATPFALPGMGAFSTNPTGNPPQVATTLPPFQIPGMNDASLLRMLAPVLAGRAGGRAPVGLGRGGIPAGPSPAGLPPLYEPQRVGLPTAPTAPKKSEWQEQKPFLMALAMLASSFTRQPAVAAMNAMAGMMKGEREGNQQAYQNSRAEYEDNLTKAAAEQRQELEEYERSYRNRQMTWAEKVAEMRAYATKRGHATMLQTLNGGQDPGPLLDSYGRAGVPIQEKVKKAAFIKEQMAKDPKMPYVEAEAQYRAQQSSVRRGGDANLPPLGDYSKQGAEFIASLPPADRDYIVSAARGDARVPTGKWSTRQRDAIFHLNPNLSETTFGARQAAERALSAGAPAQNIMAVNTAIYHLGRLDNMIDALNNTDFPRANKGFIRWAQETGDPTYIGVSNNIHAATRELARVFKGTGVITDSEIREHEGQISAAMSPRQLHAAVRSFVDLLNGRLQNIESYYTQRTGHPVTVLSPESEKTKERLEGGGPQPGTVMDGYRFKGGDPAKQENWERAQ